MSQFRLLVSVTDIAIILIATVLMVASQAAIGGVTAFAPSHTSTLAFCMLVAPVWMLVVTVFHTRDRGVLGTGRLEYKRMAASGFVTLGVLAAVFVAMEPELVREAFFAPVIGGALALTAARWGWKSWLERQPHSTVELSRTIVVGKARDIDYVLRCIHDRLSTSHTIAGVVLLGKPVSRLPEVSDGCAVFMGRREIARAASELNVDTVIVAGSASRNPRFLQELAWRLEGTAAQLVIAGELYDVPHDRVHFQHVEGMPLIRIDIPRFSGAEYTVKRTFDVVSSGLALLLLAPLMTVIAVLIRLDSEGGVLFSQERCGRDGRRFRIWKFRTMVATAEKDLVRLMDQNEGAGVLFKMRDDPRITRIGAVLRKYSLDELPQLWNIFIGDMSVVGPRPPLPTEVAQYESNVRRRLHIKPGLTGLWQVSGRSDLSWDESVKLDLYYVENWSLGRDLAIIWRTFATVIRPKGAY